MISCPEVTVTVHRRKLSLRAHHRAAQLRKCWLRQSASSLSLSLIIFACLSLSFSSCFEAPASHLYFYFPLFLRPSLYFSFKKWALIKTYPFLSLKPDCMCWHCTGSHHYEMSAKQNLLLFVFYSVTHSLPCERSNSSTIALTKENHAKASFPSHI